MSDVRMAKDHFGLLELGSNSLKFYLVGPGPGTNGEHTIETHKFPWAVSHDFFTRGTVSEAAVDQIIQRLLETKEVAQGVPLHSMLAIATGVFREIEGMDELVARVKKETGVRIRVISGLDEAELMARGFRKGNHHLPVLFCDLGGATMEWIWLNKKGRGKWGSLRLGAIRNECLFKPLRPSPQEYLQKSFKHTDGLLANWPFETVERVELTGGTAKALARHLNSDVIHLDALRHLTVRVLEHGPPEGLKPTRAEVFLAGLVIIWRVLVRCRAKEVYYNKAAVRHGMVLRLIRLLEEMPREQLHATLLLQQTDLRLKNLERDAGEKE